MNEIAVVEQHAIAPAEANMTAVQIRAQVNLIQEVMQSVMKDGTHYGTIPGTQAPSLYKPGAEKIMATFRLSADPSVEDLSGPDDIRYRVKITLVSPTGVVAGYGMGECSSGEEKYKWRKAVCKAEFEATPEDRRRVKFYRNGNSADQIRTEPADLANTVLKMSKKRALVDAVLTTTAASDIFTQDIEDIPEELHGTVTGNTAPVEMINKEQANTIQSMLVENELDMTAFLDWVEKKTGVRGINSLPTTAFDAVIKNLKQSIAAKSDASND